LAGNPNPKGSKPDKLMRDALILALNRVAKGADGQPTKKLYMIADAVVDKAAEGDVAAAVFVRDSTDGKPTQTIAGDTENPLFPVDALREALGIKLDRISHARSEIEAQGRLN
jgi:hypothetical protein